MGEEWWKMQLGYTNVCTKQCDYVAKLFGWPWIVRKSRCHIQLYVKYILYGQIRYVTWFYKGGKFVSFLLINKWCPWCNLCPIWLYMQIIHWTLIAWCNQAPMNYLLKIWPFEKIKNRILAKLFTKVGSIFFQSLNELSTDCQTDKYFSNSW